MEGEKYRPTPEEIKKAEETMTEEQKIRSEARAEGFVGGREEGKEYEKNLRSINKEIIKIENQLVTTGDSLLARVENHQTGIIRDAVTSFINILKKENTIYEDAERLGIKFDEIDLGMMQPPYTDYIREKVIESLMDAKLYKDALAIAEVPWRGFTENSAISRVKAVMGTTSAEDKE